MSAVLQNSPAAKAEPSVSELVAARRPGHMLPADFYLRQDVYELDLQQMFERQWLFVGTAADVPEAGDALTVDISGTSVMIVRGDDDTIRAFHNVCCHRGSRILDGSGSVAKLVCPYHQWTYDLDGKLLFAKTMGKDFDPSPYQLKSVNLRNIGGLLFVCLADNAPKGIDNLERVMSKRLAPYDLANAKIACKDTIIENCNWKLTIENNRECYHCPTGHPELIRSYPLFALGCEIDSLQGQEKKDAEAFAERKKRELAEFEANGFGSEYVDTTGPKDDTYFSSERFLIAGAGESATMDAKAACKKLLGSIKTPKMADLNMYTHNSWHHFFGDHAVVISVTPLSPGKTEVTTRWLVHKDAVEGKDYDLDNLTKVWKATNHEDSTFVARQQHGVGDPGYVPGPYSPTMETFVDKFVNWYLARLQAAGY